MRVSKALQMLLILLLSMSTFTTSSYSIRIIISDYSEPKSVIRWTRVPGENYVVHVFANASPLDEIKEQTLVFNVSDSKPSNVCKLMSESLSRYNVRISCDQVSPISTIIVFKDSHISKEDLIDILSSINTNKTIYVDFVPYESRDFYGLIELDSKYDVMGKIWDELYSVFGKSKFKGVFGIGQSLYDNGVLELYANNFSEDDITLIFRIVRKYIPEDIRFTIILYHYIPKSEPLVDVANSPEHPIGEYILFLALASSLAVAVATLLYIRKRP